MNDDDRPKNGDIVSASRLIAETTVVNDLPDLLHEPTQTSFGGYVSVDDIYCSLRFHNDEAGIKFNELAMTVQCDGRPEHYESNKANAWRNLWVYSIGGSSVRLGIGFNDVSGKIVINKGSIQFNPNKVKDSKALRLLFKKIRRFTKRIELKRYDIAVDIPVPRDSCRMMKDKRKYEYINGGKGITEYLGTRNKAGRVKLYDKTKELRHEQGITIGEEYTRLELTCDGEWTPEKTLEHFPTVFAWDDRETDEDTRQYVKAIGLLASLAIEHGEQVDFALDMLSKTAKKKVINYLASPCVNLTIEDIEHARNRAYEWLSRIENGETE